MNNIILRSLILAVVLLALTRIMGKRVVGQLSAIDFIAGITLGTIAGSVAVQPSISLWDGIWALATWSAFQLANAMLGMASTGYRNITSGKTTVLIKSGVFQPAGLRAVQMSETSVLSELRARGVHRLEEVECATLEPSGKMGLEKKTSSKEEEGPSPFSPKELRQA